MAGKRMLLGIVVVGVFCSAAFALAPMGPPMAGLPQGQYSYGLGYGYSDMDLEVSGPVSTSGGSSVLDNVQSNIFYLCLGYGITDDTNIRGALATVDAAFDADRSGRDFDGDTTFGYGLGVTKTLAKNGNTTWGALAQFTSALKSEDELNVAAGGQTLGNGAIRMSPGRNELRLEWYEFQLAFGPTFPVCEHACLYGGPFLHFVEGDLQIKGGGDRDEYELEQQTQLGVYVGTLVDLSDLVDNASLSAELQYTDDAWALGIGAMFKH